MVFIGKSLLIASFCVSLVSISFSLFYSTSTGYLPDLIHNTIERSPNRVRRNWENAFGFKTREFFLPTTKEEIIELVKLASRTNRTIKVVGAGHSWMDIAVPEDIMISLDSYKEIISFDLQQSTVTVQAGIRLYQLEMLLAEQKLAFINLPSVDAQSIAGAISVGTHGTGIQFQNLAAQILSLELITGTGEVLQISNTENTHLFDVVRVGLGALGIISVVTLQCVPYYFLEEIKEPNTFANWTNFEVFESLYRQDARVKIWYLPIGVGKHGFEVNSLIYTARDLQEKKSRIVGRRSKIMLDIEVWAYELVQWICAKFPTLTPQLFYGLTRVGLFKSEYKIGPSHQILHVPHRVPQHAEIEFAVPLENALFAILEFQQYIETNQLMINHIVEIRFVARDSIWLSPNYQQDSCHITLLLYNWNDENRNQYFKGFETIMFKYQGRPHWAKWFYLSKVELQSLYPQWDQFNKIRKRLDPNGIFLNDYLRRYFL